VSLRVVVAIAVIAVAGLGYFAWNRSAERAPQATTESGGADMGGGAGPGASGSMPTLEAPKEDPGITWKTPSGWQTQGPQGVRLATYAVPAHGGSESPQCAVYFFGPGQGGGVNPNLQRWIGEFENPGRHDLRTLKADGIPISRVEVSGTYLAHAMDAAGSGGKRPDWGLLGAIAEGPSGNLFFKLTGPASAVNAAAKDFDAMLASIHKR